MEDVKLEFDRILTEYNLERMSFDEAHNKLFDLYVVSQRSVLLFCGGCGNKKQLIVETDINSQRVCKNKLCEQNNCG